MDCVDGFLSKSPLKVRSHPPLFKILGAAFSRVIALIQQAE